MTDIYDLTPAESAPGPIWESIYDGLFITRIKGGWQAGDESGEWHLVKMREADVPPLNAPADYRISLTLLGSKAHVIGWPGDAACDGPTLNGMGDSLAEAIDALLDEMDTPIAPRRAWVSSLGGEFRIVRENMPAPSTGLVMV